MINYHSRGGQSNILFSLLYLEIEMGSVRRVSHQTFSIKIYKNPSFKEDRIFVICHLAKYSDISALIFFFFVHFFVLEFHSPAISMIGSKTLKRTNIFVSSIIDSLLIPDLNNILNDVPNIITPNGDGKNDCFTLSSLIDFTKCMNVTIFNRWGEKVFATTSTNNCWNGKNLNGNDVPDGTYFYVLEVNGKKFQGTVAVMRK